MLAAAIRSEVRGPPLSPCSIKLLDFNTDFDSHIVHKSKDQMVFFMFDNDDSIFKIFLNGLVTKSEGIDDHKAMLPAT